LEYRGKALYDSVIQKTDSNTVKDLFTMLSNEEEQHLKILTDQFRRIAKGENFYLKDIDSIKPNYDEAILSKEIVGTISGAGYEAAVIAAAVDFEKKAVAFYSEQAEKAESDEEKKMYIWLAEWEKGHLELFVKVDKEMREQIWYDNKFWPF
jgi:rubrerythrin